MTDLDDDVDRHVDSEIDACLKVSAPRSFFLFAGAGSGKTHSLVTALKRFRAEAGRQLKLQRRRVGVITYTNAACDEIKQRLEYDPLVEVSTIHSFVWALIKNLNADIRRWVEADLRVSIDELTAQQRKGRAGSQAAIDRARKLESKQRRLEALATVTQFTYSPTGDNRTRDALNHAEVIKIGAEFLTKRAVMQSILVNRFPVLLIDESQDTNKHLMDAFLKVQEVHRERFILGLFGDTMQRIYADGKVGLGENLPHDWATPKKVMNHRCPKRVVRLINRIRASVDAQEQRARSDKEEGAVRLFLLDGDTPDKPSVERAIMEQMSRLTRDSLWSGQSAIVKTLMLEHLMAARRMGFVELFQPLSEVDGGNLRTGLLEGALPGLRFFVDTILPLRAASMNNDEFATAALVRRTSPLLSKAVLRPGAGSDQAARVKSAQLAVKEVIRLWADDRDPVLMDIVESIRRTGLFELPESLQLVSKPDPKAPRSGLEEEELQGAGDERDPVIEAWEKTLKAPLSQVEAYATYVRGEAPFGTHQGIKGLEFPRVLVVMDDTESKGFLFSYEKLFGAVAPSPTDLERQRSGEESTLDRTRRLLYVTCSRAERSLALVAYSTHPQKVREHVLKQGWFDETEIVMGVS